MGTMDNAIAPIGNIKFDIEVALGKEEAVGQLFANLL